MTYLTDCHSRAYHRRKKKKYYLWGVLFECHYAYKNGIWAQKVEKVNFHLVKMAPKGVIEKNEKVLKTPLSTHIS